MKRIRVRTNRSDITVDQVCYLIHCDDCLVSRRYVQIPECKAMLADIMTTHGIQIEILPEGDADEPLDG